MIVSHGISKKRWADRFSLFLAARTGRRRWAPPMDGHWAAVLKIYTLPGGGICHISGALRRLLFFYRGSLVRVGSPARESAASRKMEPWISRRPPAAAPLRRFLHDIPPARRSCSRNELI